eukprot:scpid20194/ scgid12241/ 
MHPTFSTYPLQNFKRTGTGPLPSTAVQYMYMYGAPLLHLHWAASPSSIGDISDFYSTPCRDHPRITCAGVSFGSTRIVTHFACRKLSALALLSALVADRADLRSRLEAFTSFSMAVV